jgi:peptidoglycan hydrolase-like protein with peptidoglycan-binding domain
MRNILRRPRTVVVATALAGSLVLGVAAAAHADSNSPHDPTSAPSVATPPAATAATAGTDAESAESAEAATCSTTYLSYGSRGTCVRLLQKNLGGLSVDGVYGSGTRSRVRSFQDDAGITVDGKVGPQTWRKLRTYGKALAWVAGVTLYMCKASSTQFQYSAWNNSGSSVYWTLFTRDGLLDGPRIRDDRIAIEGTIPAGAHDAQQFVVYFDDATRRQSTTRVRDFSRNTLPACA